MPEMCPWCGYWVQMDLPLHIDRKHSEQEADAKRWEELITAILQTKRQEKKS